MHENSVTASHEASTLLRAIAGDLRTPLTTIARQSELGLLTDELCADDMQLIRTQATAALALVDGYLMGLDLLRQQTQLALEPVSLSSMLADTAHSLDGLARQYGVDLELHIAGRYTPVMAHAAGLKSAFLSLGAALLDGGAFEGRKRLTLAVHRTPQGMVSGVYGDFANVSTRHWRKALELQGTADQPFRSVSGSGAGLFVADTILQAMATRLRVGRHLHQQGLATTLQPSRQLRFV